jgi:hypothetical protein
MEDLSKRSHAPAIEAKRSRTRRAKSEAAHATQLAREKLRPHSVLDSMRHTYDESSPLLALKEPVRRPATSADLAPSAADGRLDALAARLRAVRPSKYADEDWGAYRDRSIDMLSLFYPNRLP